MGSRASEPVTEKVAFQELGAGSVRSAVVQSKSLVGEGFWLGCEGAHTSVGRCVAFCSICATSVDARYCCMQLTDQELRSTPDRACRPTASSAKRARACILLS